MVFKCKYGAQTHCSNKSYSANPTLNSTLIENFPKSIAIYVHSFTFYNEYVIMLVYKSCGVNELCYSIENNNTKEQQLPLKAK